MTPVLVLLFGVHPATAVGTDLLFAAATKSVGTMVHGLNHTIDWRITGRLASGSVPAAAITLIAVSHFGLSGAVGNEIISIGLAIMLLLAAANLLGFLLGDPEAWFQAGVTDELREKVEALIVQRVEARAAKDWAAADRIRDELTALNIEVMDGPTGATWRIKEAN